MEIHGVKGKYSRDDRFHLKKIYRKFGQSIHDYELIEDGDRVLVGLSGGKDSLALLQLLQQRNRISGNKYTVMAVHIMVKEISYQVRMEYLKSFCNSLGVELLIREVSFANSKTNDESVCFSCSWIRRKILFEVASLNNCNKLALGHHRDDAVETLLMNMTFQGSISSMPPKLKILEGNLTIIRPLILIAEQELINFAALMAYEKLKKDCPFENDSQRKQIKNLIKELEKLHSHAQSNLYKSMSNVQTEYLPLQSG